ncbi:MAG: peptidyl-tRNA hydrolase, family [Patescibacteria group bacterium]|jgi:PTH1 family peptidyl-tRNA hydrolase|nr:peptidyl-tRNA hydrolase, family [Patescibacteria group bacterium]MDQ5953202.1 peptidyl-tRNA hydrolase, family [Patescibacteria group bacterium]MDQ5961865.1 peptidyl-tRNA hydrolase, family [Patescibacteria group bacterium]
MYIVGLGNPGEEYKNTRHNAGRLVLEMIAGKNTDFRIDKKANAHIGNVILSEKKTTFILPNTFMNNSGQSVAPYIKSEKDLAKLVVVYDELDLPIGKIKISFNRSSGGHNGMNSIIKVVKSEEFVRIRIGVSPSTPTGKLKKVTGTGKGQAFLMKEFTPKQMDELKKVSKVVKEALEVLVSEGKDKAMTIFNGE